MERRKKKDYLGTTEDNMGVVTIVIVPLLLPYLFGKSGIFTRSPLPWVFETFLFHCYHVHLPCFILLNGSLEAQSKSKCP